MNRTKLIALSSLLIIVLITGVVVLRPAKPLPKPSGSGAAHFTDNTTGISLDYNTQLALSTKLSEQDNNDHIVLRLTDKGGNTKPFLISVRYEKDLAKAASITKQSLLDYLQSSAALNLAKKQGYQQIEVKRIKVSSRQAIQHTFTYIGQQTTPTQQRLLIIPVDDDRAVYIAMQAKVADFDSMNTELFAELQSSISLN